MSRYKLTIEEKTTRTHEVVIETDKSIDTICDYIERSDNAINDPWDIRYIAGVNLVSVEEQVGSRDQRLSKDTERGR